MDDPFLSSHPQPGRPKPSEPGSAAAHEIAGYELLAKLGQGGMGTVFKARQRSMDRVVALKVLAPRYARDPQYTARFVQEARASAKLSHPHIVQGIDVGQDPLNQAWFFAMEFVDGPTLKQIITRDGPLAERRALEVCRDIARALEEATRQGIVHRDIKPDNILISSRGITKLADLGLAKQQHDDSALTQAGQSLGTPLYMAPEQIRGRDGEIDARTDLYALGATLFHLLTGTPPFRGETSAVVMAKHLSEPPPRADALRPGLRTGTVDLIVRLMAKERADRLPSPTALVRALDAILDGGDRDADGADQDDGADGDREATTPSRVGRFTTARQRRRLPVPVIALAAGALVVVATIVAFSRGSPKPSAAAAAADAAAAPVAKLPSAPAVRREAAPAERVPTDLRQMLGYVQEWEKKHPDDYVEARQRYAKVAKQAEGTALELEIKDEVELALAAVQDRQHAAVGTTWLPIAAKARAAASTGDYDAALAAAMPPPELARALADSAAELAKTLRAEAEARLGEAIAKAEDASRRAEPDEALAALDAVATVSYAPWAPRLAALRTRLVGEQANAGALAARRARLAAETRLGTHLRAFTSGLAAKGDLAAARAAVAAAAADPIVATLPETITAMREVLAAIDDDAHRRQSDLAALKGRTVTVGKDTGTVLGIADGMLSLELTFAGGVAVKRIRMTDLSETERSALFPRAPATVTPAAQVAAAAVQLADPAADLVAVERLLTAAGTFPLVAHYRTLIAVRRAADAERAAALSWPALARSAGTPPNDALAARAVAAQIEQWQARYGATAFAIARAGELATWSVSVQALAAVELLINPGFEEGLPPWRQGKGAPAVLREEGAKSGKQCLSYIGNPLFRLMQQVTLEVGATYEISGHVRWLDGGAEGLAVYAQYGFDRNGAPQVPPATRAAHTPTPWIAFSTTFVAKRARDTVMIERRLSGGSFLIDGFSLIRTKAPPSTDKAPLPPPLHD